MFGAVRRAGPDFYTENDFGVPRELDVGEKRVAKSRRSETKLYLADTGEVDD